MPRGAGTIWRCMKRLCRTGRGGERKEGEMKEREGGGGGGGGTEFHEFSSNFTQNSIPCALSTFFDIYSFLEVKFSLK